METSCGCGKYTAQIEGNTVFLNIFPAFEEKYWLGAKDESKTVTATDHLDAVEWAEDHLSHCNCREYV